MIMAYTLALSIAINPLPSCLANYSDLVPIRTFTISTHLFARMTNKQGSMVLLVHTSLLTYKQTNFKSFHVNVVCCVPKLFFR